ncbi:Crp/Fnr family transcriptional regulator [Carboxydochorda subterranea]|uniref:Crp/Fnr family transcriptional regulator n=1 Tax=Carboxydichorda subterranea TaxID=3109565 RepID=A0ABZ1BWS1_9FIRM|nr:Crp/Fnr family transcriptional regulator [Limnochorda sp. L945t]WRP16558.1 Crp/Fnr family transcriptional regulator [Limnochorda sp. L945t]
MPAHAACFRRVPLFAELTEPELEELAAGSHPRHFRSGEVVFRAGEAPGYLYVVSSGLVKVVRTSADGREQVVRLLGPGDFYGELALFHPQPLPATAVALAEAEICLLSRPHVEALLRCNPAASLKMLRALSARVGELEALVEQLAVHPVEERVAALLVKLATAGGPIADGVVVKLPLKQEELARVVGTTQETLSRRLHVLEDEGIIRLEGRRLVRLLDAARLIERAGRI